MRHPEAQIDELYVMAQKEEEVRRRDIVQGGEKAGAYIRNVALGKREGKQRLGFNGDFVREIHRRVMNNSDEGGVFRTRNVRIGSDEAVDSSQVPHKFYVYSKWLEYKMEEVGNHPDDILLALETAAAAHWGLTSPELHPFINGNGRTARALVNAILMHSTDELRLHRIPILPVPILRDEVASSTDKKKDKYIKALEQVRVSSSLNPLMSFIAQRWSENVSRILKAIEVGARGSVTEADRRLIDTLQMREGALDDFVSDGNGAGKNNFRVYPIPNYFDPVWLKGERIVQAL